MNADTTAAKNIMFDNTYSCVLCCGEEKVFSSERGVKPLLLWIEEKVDLKGYSAADRVVGKAAAFLYVLLGVREVYSPVMSESAVDVFKEFKINAYYDKKVQHIINRKGDGICPMEEATANETEPLLALYAIKSKLLTLKTK